MTIRSRLLTAGALASGMACAGGFPAATLTSVEQTADRTIEVTYETANAPAVVTWSMVTNGAPVSGRALGTALGEINVLVRNGTHVFSWRPDDVTDDRLAAFSAENAEVRLTAWPTNNPPDYMVVDLLPTAAHRVRYYPDAESLPGGLLENVLYKESAIVMRRIHAEGLPWVMGGVASGSHVVTLDHDYYLGVFELTQAQHRTLLYGVGTPSVFYGVEGGWRPSDRVSYNLLRGTTGNSGAAPETNTPDPTPTSVLGRLRTRTGVEFEMPTEAEWEFAAVADSSLYCWPHGPRIAISGDADVNVPGRYKGNGGLKQSSSIYDVGEVGPTNATAVVGSYAPNSFGLYDMSGNVEEWCRDWYKADIVQDGGSCIENKQNSGAASDYHRVLRGGSIRTGATSCLPTNRASLPPHGCIDNWGNFVGYRPYAPCCAK